MHRVLFKITLQQRSATPVQAQCTNRQLGFTQILSLLQNEHCNGNGWARSCEGPSATFSEEADCTAVQPFVKVIVLQMELGAFIAVTPIYSCTLSFLGVFVPLPCQYVSYFMSWLICGFD